MADAPGSANFMVDLAALSDATDAIAREHDTIGQNLTSLKSTFVDIQNHWVSPAGASFNDLVTEFNKVSDDLQALLDEAVGKMKTTHQSYLTTEETNTANYQERVVDGGNQQPQDGDATMRVGGSPQDGDATMRVGGSPQDGTVTTLDRSGLTQGGNATLRSGN